MNVKQRITNFKGVYLTELGSASIMHCLLRGIPMELTGSSAAVIETRGILEREHCFILQGREYDIGGSVYWSPDKRVAIICFTRSSLAV